MSEKYNYIHKSGVMEERKRIVRIIEDLGIKYIRMGSIKEKAFSEELIKLINKK